MKDIFRLISRTADGGFVIDSDHRIILWNHSARAILGFSSGEVLGKFCYEVLPGMDPAGNLFCFRGCSVLTMAKQGRLIQNYDVRMTAKTGRKVWLNVSTLLVPSRRRKGPVILHLFRSVPGPERLEGLEERVASTVLTTLKECGDSSPYCSRTGPAPVQISSPSTTTSLTRRETEILTLLAQCKGTKEIAGRLCISHDTVRSHVQNTFKKLQVHSKLEAVVLAFQQNLLQTKSSGELRLPSNQSL